MEDLNKWWSSLTITQKERIAVHGLEKCSPHVDNIGKRYRYLRVSINEGIKGIWEWKVYK